MTSAKKISSNRLTATRTRKALKRKPHVKALIKAQKKINMRERQMDKLLYLRKRYGTRPNPVDSAPLI